MNEHDTTQTLFERQLNSLVKMLRPRAIHVTQELNLQRMQATKGK